MPSILLPSYVIDAIDFVDVNWFRLIYTPVAAELID